MRSICASSICLLLAGTFANTAAAKECVAAPNYLHIELAASGYHQAIETVAYTFTGWSILSDYGTILLGEGDSVTVTFGTSYCGSTLFLSKDGIAQDPPAPHVQYRFAEPGYYVGWNCDTGCEELRFTIVPLAGAQGQPVLSTTMRLGGAVEMGVPASPMRTALHDQGLLPSSEPYSAMGYVFQGGGGEVMSPWVASMDLVDWVVVELRDAVDPTLVVASRTALVRRWGTVVDPQTGGPLAFNAPPGYYHIAARHRNHLGCMTAVAYLLGGEAPVEIPIFGFHSPGALFGQDAVYSIAQRLAFWPGNALFDLDAGALQQVKYTGANNDRDAVLARIGGTTPTATITGYFNEDLNLDGAVKYTGSMNDRDVILQTIGGQNPTAVRAEQLP